MKKKILALCILCFMILNMIIIPASAAVTNPYGTTSTGCITNISMKTHTKLRNEVEYFTATVTSKVSGTSSKTLSYETFGAVGGDNTKLFVYSIGNSSDTDFARKTVKEIMQQFATDNPDWIPLVAINGDFFDAETGNTSTQGEPENVMIQMGNVLKGHPLETTPGCGTVGIQSNGNVIFDINGFSSASTPYRYAKNYYDLTIMSSDKATVLGQHKRIPADTPNTTVPTFVTPDSASKDLTGLDVYVVSCDTYRYAYKGGLGQVDSQGDYTYFFSGTVQSKRAGTTNEKPSKGQVYIAVPSGVQTTLAAGKYVKANTAITSSDWKNVENAFGFKQAILVNGDSEFVKGMTNASAATDKVGDTEYSYCWKHRTAIGFKDDGTPVFLVIKKATNDLGASYYEMAEQLKTLGCKNGFVLDGGGSSTMIINNNGTYENAFIGEGSGRPVGNAIILAVPKSGTIPTPNPGGDTTETPTEKPSEDTTKPDTENTFVSIDKGNGYIEHTATLNNSVAGKISVSGNAKFSQNIINSGYYFDSDTENMYLNSNFLSEGESADIANGNTKDMNFNIEANTSDLSAGEHTVNFVLKLRDGTFVIIESVGITVSAQTDSSDKGSEETTTEANSAPVTDESSGCGSSIGGISAIIIALTASATLFVRKKRK